MAAPGALPLRGRPAARAVQHGSALDSPSAVRPRPLWAVDCRRPRPITRRQHSARRFLRARQERAAPVTARSPHIASHSRAPIEEPPCPQPFVPARPQLSAMIYPVRHLKNFKIRGQKAHTQTVRSHICGTSACSNIH